MLTTGTVEPDVTEVTSVVPLPHRMQFTKSIVLPVPPTAALEMHPTLPFALLTIVQFTNVEPGMLNVLTAPDVELVVLPAITQFLTVMFETSEMKIAAPPDRLVAAPTAVVELPVK